MKQKNNLDNFELIHTHFNDEEILNIVILNYIRHIKNNSIIPILIFGNDMEIQIFIQEIQKITKYISLKKFREIMVKNGIILRYFDDYGFNSNDLSNIKKYLKTEIVFFTGTDSKPIYYPLDIICLSEFCDSQDFSNKILRLALNDYTRSTKSLLELNFLYLKNDNEFIEQLFHKFN